MGRGITRQDISDADIADAVELAADGSEAFLTGVVVVSTTAATRLVVLSGIYMLDDPDSRIEALDSIVLAGTSGADGTYIVEEIVDNVTLRVVAAIADSTGGTLAAYYPAGATRVGVDTTSFTYSTGTTLQGVLSDIDTAIAETANEGHRSLRHLIHFMSENGPGDGFGAGPLYSETSYSGSFPTTEIWYETSAKLKKICQYSVTYNVNKTIATETWTVFKTDGSSKAAEAVDTISYSGVNETSRSRAITVY